MATEVLLAQGLVLVFTAALWWIARRDLASRIPPPALSVPADTAEMEQLCATLESLVVSLARRLEAVEARLPKLKAVPIFAVPEPPTAEEAAIAAEPPDARYAPVYALVASGISDPVEIARRTGLGRGEVDLILSLRDRRAF